MQNGNSLKMMAPVMMAFYVMGFVDIVGVSTAYIKNDFSLSDSTAQLLPGMVFLWFALISLPTGLLQDRKGRRFTVNLGQLITGAGLVIPWIYYSFPTALLGFAMLGIGNTMLQVSANPLLLAISSQNSKAANLSFSQFVKATASMLGPVITAIFARHLGDWRNVFLVYAALSFLSAIWLSRTRVSEAVLPKEPATFKSILKLLNCRFVGVLILAVFLIVGFDVGMNTNIALYLQQKFNIELEISSMAISVYFAALMLGRFSGAFFLRKLNAQNFLVITTLFTLASLAGILISNNHSVSLVFIFLSGIGFANIFPVIFAELIEYKPDYANELSSLIIVSIAGGAIVPPLMGILSDYLGKASVVYVLIFCMLYVLIASIYIRKHKHLVTAHQ